MSATELLRALLPDSQLSLQARSVLHTLLYFDVFSYPLKTEEVYHFCNDPELTPILVRRILDELTEAKLLHKRNDFYALKVEDGRVENRVEGNERADKLMKKAYRKSRFIGSFPFVRSVMLSGSISKGYVSEDADIDYFIITEPGKLWLARTMLIAWKKLFLLNSYRFFCVNYFIDTDHLTIEEQNHFTATELKTLFPTYGAEYYPRLHEANRWADQYLPNHGPRDLKKVVPHRVRGFKWLGELMLNNRFGSWIDGRCMKLTLKFWRKKFDRLDQERFDLALKSRTYVSKHHPHNFQERIMNAYHEKVRNFETTFDVSLVRD